MKEALIKLILAGEDLVDGAETCGHDDSVEEWNAAVKSISKKFNITKEDINAVELKLQADADRVENQKNKKLLLELEEKKKRDVEILKEFGIKQ